MDKSGEKQIEWDIGTAYDFFVSLWVLHEPEQLGLRGSWAAGVRSRLPAAERELLQKLSPITWALPWVHSLPAPKDVVTMLAALRDLPAEARLFAITSNVPDPIAALWRNVAARGAWGEADLKIITDVMQSGDDWKQETPARISQIAADSLDIWADRDGAAAGVLAAYECYQEVFFAEEEARIRPALQNALNHAQEQAMSITRWEELLEVLSQGVRIAKDWEDKTVVLVPSYWATPLALMANCAEDRRLFLFGARPADESLIPGDVVPDALHQALKALADPTRLRILRYLSEESLTPAELARRLRLRPPTVIHHLDALRLARLVIVTLEAEGKRYAIRPDAVASVCELLQGFLAA